MTEKELLNLEKEVLNRYKKASKIQEDKLCCDINYDNKYLEVIPEEIKRIDYGCGNPSKYVKEGETVVDLGSGAGKICYILSQIVGKNGKVIGIDFNDDMLDLARKYKDEIENKIGYKNVEFRKGKIQDLSLNLDLLQEWIDKNPIKTVEDLNNFAAHSEKLRQEEPLIAESTVDVIVSNCVLNLVRPQDREQLFEEMNRILKPAGRAIISDVVSDEEPTPEIFNNPELWSGCISGAFREDHFIEMFEDAGFYGIEILERSEEPWQVIDGIEFRSITVRAFKEVEYEEYDKNHAIIYKGPWFCVSDENGNTFLRGERTAVSDVNYELITDPQGPFIKDIIPVPPYEEVTDDEAELYDVDRDHRRDPGETKGSRYCRSAGVCKGTDCCK